MYMGHVVIIVRSSLLCLFAWRRNFYPGKQWGQFSFVSGLASPQMYVFTHDICTKQTYLCICVSWSYWLRPPLPGDARQTRPSQACRAKTSRQVRKHIKNKSMVTRKHAYSRTPLNSARLLWHCQPSGVLSCAIHEDIYQLGVRKFANRSKNMQQELKKGKLDTYKDPLRSPYMVGLGLLRASSWQIRGAIWYLLRSYISGAWPCTSPGPGEFVETSKAGVFASSPRPTPWQSTRPGIKDRTASEPALLRGRMHRLLLVGIFIPHLPSAGQHASFRGSPCICSRTAVRRALVHSLIASSSLPNQVELRQSLEGPWYLLAYSCKGAITTGVCKHFRMLFMRHWRNLVAMATAPGKPRSEQVNINSHGATSAPKDCEWVWYWTFLGENSMACGRLHWSIYACIMSPHLRLHMRGNPFQQNKWPWIQSLR